MGRNGQPGPQGMPGNWYEVYMKKSLWPYYVIFNSMINRFWLNFYLGADGQKGEVGNQGATGIQGPMGMKGHQGERPIIWIRSCRWMKINTYFHSAFKTFIITLDSHKSRKHTVHGFFLVKNFIQRCNNITAFWKKHETLFASHQWIGTTINITFFFI